MGRKRIGGDACLHQDWLCSLGYVWRSVVSRVTLADSCCAHPFMGPSLPITKEESRKDWKGVNSCHEDDGAN